MAKQGRLRSLWDWVKPDSWKSVLDISIGVVGTLIALWGVYKFYYYERGAYEPRANVSSTLEWRPSNLSNQCEAIFSVQIENLGISAFDVSEIRVRVWAFDSAVLNNQKAAYLSLDHMAKGNVLFDSADASFKPAFETTETPFVGHYSLAAKFHRSFHWLIARDAGSNVYFRTDFTLKDNDTRWFTAAWGPLCGEAQSPKLASPTPSPSK